MMRKEISEVLDQLDRGDISKDQAQDILEDCIRVRTRPASSPKELVVLKNRKVDGIVTRVQYRPTDCSGRWETENIDGKE